jgi:hypothetical protein
MKRPKHRASDFLHKPRGSNFKRDDASQLKGSPDERQRGSTVYRCGVAPGQSGLHGFEATVLPPHMRSIDNRQPEA